MSDVVHFDAVVWSTHSQVSASVRRRISLQPLFQTLLGVVVESRRRGIAGIGGAATGRVSWPRVLESLRLSADPQRWTPHPAGPIYPTSGVHYL